MRTASSKGAAFRTASASTTRPPDFPLSQASRSSWAGWLDLREPEHLGQLVSALAVVATGVIVLLLARLLWPARPALWVASVGFFAFLPTVAKAGAMFHPEPLAMLLTAGALLVLAWMVRARAYSGWIALVARRPARARAPRARLVALDAGRGRCCARRRGSERPCITDAEFSRRSPSSWPPQRWSPRRGTSIRRRGTRIRSSTGPQPDKFILARRPLSFYIDARVPDVVERPWSGRFDDRFWAVLYAETWGDYFGIWSWGTGRGDRTDAIDATLARQSWLGVLPSLLALGGVLALLGLAVTRPREDVGRLIVALPPVAAVASILLLSIAYPSTDGDTIKGTYALAAAPATALCFGFAVDVLARRRVVGIVLGVALAATALALLPFVVW